MKRIHGRYSLGWRSEVQSPACMYLPDLRSGQDVRKTNHRTRRLAIRLMGYNSSSTNCVAIRASALPLHPATTRPCCTGIGNGNILKVHIPIF